MEATPGKVPHCYTISLFVVNASHCNSLGSQSSRNLAFSLVGDVLLFIIFRPSSYCKRSFTLWFNPTDLAVIRAEVPRENKINILKNVANHS